MAGRWNVKESAQSKLDHLRVMISFSYKNFLK